jgi:2'-5' RNA ligase
MRLFVAIPLDARCVARATALVRDLRAHTQAIAPEARVTWAAADRMHLTLEFIGETDDDRRAAIMDVLQAPVALDPFDIEWAGVGTFPDRGSPRVAWVGVGRGRSALDALQRELSDRLGRTGWRDDGRPFQPHLTLARVRDPDGLRVSSWIAPVAARSLGATRVTHAALFESRLHPGGAEHVVLLRIPLVP